MYSVVVSRTGLAPDSAYDISWVYLELVIADDLSCRMHTDRITINHSSLILLTKCMLGTTGLFLYNP